MPDNQTNKERLKEITDSIETGIREMFQSEKYFQYLRTMSRFHKYSVNNTMLIYLQRPNATLVAGFNKWEKEFERHVIKGERGIRIIAPTPFKKKIEQEKLDPDTQLPVLDGDGNVVMEEKVVKIPMYKPVTVFDVSQTYGKPLPQLTDELTGDVKNYDVFMEALRRSSPVPISFKPLDAGMDGYFSPEHQDITLREGMSEVQTICAAVHEITHAKLHNYEKEKTDDPERQVKPKDRNTEEVEAESISFSVCAYYMIDTSANSLGYIASWSSGRDLAELRASLEIINKTASGLITDIDRNFAEICRERGIDRSAQAEVEAEAAESAEVGRSTKAEKPDTTEQYAEDYCAFVDKTYHAGVIEKPFFVDAAERIPDIAHLLQTGSFTSIRESLQQASKSGYDPAAVNALLHRLDALEKQWEAAMVYQVQDYDLSVGEHNRCCIYEYHKDGDTLTKRGIVFVGPAALCQELAQKLNDRSISVKEVPEMAREAPTAEAPKKPFIDHFYVVDDLERPGKLDIQLCNTFEEAIAAYFRLPADKVKALGVGNTNPLPGSLDFIQCKGGADTLIEDYKKVEGWQNPEVDALVSKIGEALSLRREQARERQEETPPLADLNLPDPAISIETMNAYGYVSDDMLPLTKERAAELFAQDAIVYMLLEGNTEQMVIEPEDITYHTGMFGITRDDWNEIKDSIPAPAPAKDARQRDMEQKFLERHADGYMIYQRDPSGSNRDGTDLSMDAMKVNGRQILREDYTPVYAGDLPKYGTTEEKLEQVYERFNMNRPADYAGRDLSVSDIIVLRQGGVVSSHYVDSVGFPEVPGFLAPEKYLKNAELAMEDDANMIDGIINNGVKQPTVADLEAQVNAGRQISVLELAEAAKREERAKKSPQSKGKKPSVLAKLRHYKNLQAAQPQERKSAERDSR